LTIPNSDTIVLRARPELRAGVRGDRPLEGALRGGARAGVELHEHEPVVARLEALVEQRARDADVRQLERVELRPGVDAGDTQAEPLS
jgi:hypothetical protein